MDSTESLAQTIQLLMKGEMIFLSKSIVLSSKFKAWAMSPNTQTGRSLNRLRTMNWAGIIVTWKVFPPKGQLALSSPLLSTHSRNLLSFWAT